MVTSNPRAEMPEDAKFVPIEEAQDYGYHGITPDIEDDHIYTVAGVTESDKAAEADSKAAQGDSKAAPAAKPSAKQAANREANK